MSFAVVRHPGLDTLGTLPREAIELARHNGWYRVSEYAEAPSELNLPDYADVFTDLDKPDPEPEPDVAPDKPDTDEEK